MPLSCPIACSPTCPRNCTPPGSAALSRKARCWWWRIRQRRLVGLAGFGAARDRGLGHDGEVYTLYVGPDHLGRGAGRALLHGAFGALKQRGFQSCVIWSHARNHACYFYEAMGGMRVGERRVILGGMDVDEVAFGWKKLALSPRKLRVRGGQ